MLRRIAFVPALLWLAAAPGPAGAAVSAHIAATQSALRALALYSGDVDGLAGPGTSAAVRRLQRRDGLVVDGVVGPATRRALGGRGRPAWGSRVLREGRRGWDVAALQFLLGRRGFPCGPVDGGFGPRVTAAVQRLQRHAGLVADGVLGPATVRALRSPAPRLPIALRAPVPGAITDGFRPRGATFHAGVDVPAPSGTPVGAAAAGRVVEAGWLGDGFGLGVVIGHGGGVRTLYAHLSEITTATGRAVTAGERVGRVGSTGRSFGPHLHLEASVRGAAVDPAPALR